MHGIGLLCWISRNWIIVFFTVGQTSPNFFFLPVKLNVSVTIKRQTVVRKVKGPWVYANWKAERYQNAHSDKLHVKTIFSGELNFFFKVLCNKEAECQLTIDQRSYVFWDVAVDFQKLNLFLAPEHVSL